MRAARRFGRVLRPPTGHGAAFEATGAGGACDTAAELFLPMTTPESVVNTAGQTQAPLTYDRADPAAAGSSLWVYRADADGTPDAQAGACLWMQGMERGQSVNRAILTSVAARADAVQFRRPTDGATPPGALPYQLQIKIVSACDSPVRGAQSSEATDGTLVTLTVGKCALLRDHELDLDHEPVPTITSGAYNATSTD